MMVGVDSGRRTPIRPIRIVQVGTGVNGGDIPALVLKSIRAPNRTVAPALVAGTRPAATSGCLRRTY